MTSAFSNARLEEWLRHEAFLRKVLRRLLASEADVDDALQQTWTKLLERPAGVPAEPRGWLTRVARNVALGGMRARRRRSEHEAEALPRSGGDSPAESAARVEALQRVGEAILALEEPYRSVVLLRHEQELDVAAIARRLGRSESTVRSQLSRAHELLRQKLDREFGGRERWAALAVPLTSSSSAWLVPGAAVVLLATVTTYAIWRVATLPEVAPTTARTTDLSASELLSASRVEAPEADETQERAAQAREPVSSASAPAAPVQVEIVLQGRVGDVGGNQHRVHANGKLEYFRELVAEPLALAPPLEAREERAHVTAPTLPSDHVLHVRRATFTARFEGLKRAEERYAIVLGRTELVLAPYAHEGFEGTWEGDLVLDGDDLKRTYLALGSSSAGEVRLQGELERREDWERRSANQRLARVTSAVTLPLRYPVLRAPRARLQVRAGHQGGNPIQIGLAGSTSIYVDRWEASELDLTLPPEKRSEALVHFEGGHVPSDMAFVVTNATWESTTFRHGPVVPLRLVVANQELAKLAPAFPPGEGGRTASGDGLPGQPGGEDGEPGEPGWPGGGYTEDSERTPLGVPVSGSWAGRLTVLPGQEDKTYLEASYFTNGEAFLYGELVPLGALSRDDRDPYARFRASPPVAPKPKPEPSPLPELTQPRVVLQARAGHGGGNPVSLALNGKTSIYVDRVETLPLDFTQPPTSADPELVYGECGRIPAGQALVVTRATWWSATFDESSHSRFKLTVAGEVLAERKGKGDPQSGSWSGRLVIRPGGEEKTSLEVGYFAAADVLLLGHFEPLEK